MCSESVIKFNNNNNNKYCILSGSPSLQINKFKTILLYLQLYISMNIGSRLCDQGSRYRQPDEVGATFTKACIQAISRL